MIAKNCWLKDKLMFMAKILDMDLISVTDLIMVTQGVVTTDIKFIILRMKA